MSLHIPKLSLTVKAKLLDETLKDYIPGSIVDLGQTIATKIDQHVREQNIGYYPALSYFSDGDVVEPYLLDAVDQVVDIVGRISEEQMMNVLAPIFSSIVINDLRNQVYGLPTVRLNDSNALENLYEHFIADTITFELIVTLIQKSADTDTLESKVRKMILRWLTDIFCEIDITSIRLL